MTRMDRYSWIGQQRWIPCRTLGTPAAMPFGAVSGYHFDVMRIVAPTLLRGELGVAGYNSRLVTFDFPTIGVVNDPENLIREANHAGFPVSPRYDADAQNVSYAFHIDWTYGSHIAFAPQSARSQNEDGLGFNLQNVYGGGHKLCYIIPGPRRRIETAPGGGETPLTAPTVVGTYSPPQGGEFDVTFMVTIKRVTSGAAALADVAAGINWTGNGGGSPLSDSQACQHYAQFPAVSAASTQYVSISVRRTFRLAYNQTFKSVATGLTGAGTFSVVGANTALYGHRLR